MLDCLLRMAMALIPRSRRVSFEIRVDTDLKKSLSLHFGRRYHFAIDLVPIAEICETREKRETWETRHEVQ